MLIVNLHTTLNYIDVVLSADYYPLVTLLFETIAWPSANRTDFTTAPLTFISSSTFSRASSIK